MEPLLPPSHNHISSVPLHLTSEICTLPNVLPYGAGKSTGLSSLPRKSGVVVENLECREIFLLLESFL